LNIAVSLRILRCVIKFYMVVVILQLLVVLYTGLMILQEDFFYLYSFVLSLSIVLTVLSMYFIGVSGLRVLPLSINGMEWNLLATVLMIFVRIN